MKNFFQSYPVAVITVLTGVITGGLELVLHVNGALALILVLLQPTLGTCIEILRSVQVLKLHSAFTGDDLAYLLADRETQRFVQAFVASTRSVHAIGHPLLTAGTRTWTGRVESDIEDHAKGILSSDLSPFRPVLREPQLLAAVTDRMIATSLVTVADYWQSTWGQNYLRAQAEVVKRLRPHWSLTPAPAFTEVADSPVIRIFVHPRAQLPELRDVLVGHRKYRLYALVAILEDLPANLQNRDFMVIDNRLLERLDLLDGKPRKATFFVRGGKVDAEIEEALATFAELLGYAALPEVFPEIGLP